MRINRLLPVFGASVLAATRPLAAQLPLTPADSARHVLNRLAYGAMPGQIDAVVHDGVMKWVDRQLGFGEVRDPALARLEEAARVLHVSTPEMQQLQEKNQRQIQRLQAIPDSASRERALGEFRSAQQGDRQSLQALLAELQSLTVARAVLSDHQLGEILADFWSNHFNVFLNKNQDRPYFAGYLEQTIRRHALGKFEDLLIATAKSPAMLLYLDNALSVADGAGERFASLQRRGMLPPRSGRFPPANGNPGTAPASRQNAPRGLNENYARELLELHTLGADGGYTQSDVIAVARIFTGWSVDRRDASYTFRALAHDTGPKSVLGETFDGGHGEDEGLRLLKMLAAHPATMHHISAQLCARFVADAAPDGCIDDAVRAWRRSGGDMREVVRAIVHSPDFWAAANLQSKVKTPLEFVVSALRAVGGVPDATPQLARRIAQLGQPLFQKQTPDGYGERQEDWVNSGALLARMNFAVQLASGRVPGAAADLGQIAPLTDDRTALVAAIGRTILGGAMTEQTRRTILKEIADVPDAHQARALAIGLALGGPEFQKQ